MRISEHLPKLLVTVVVIGGIAIGVSRLLDTSGETGMVDVTVPALSPVAAAGEAAFVANCAECHGNNGSGTDQGPPLVHDIYNPGHHSDEAFYFAARQGVRQHHWRFGNMPPQPQATDAQLAEIVRYVRELQEANGISYRPHLM